GAYSAGSSTTSPRRTASLLMCGPLRTSAHLWPASPWLTGWFCAWIERMRASRPEGLTSTCSSMRTTPERTVPVTAVPRTAGAEAGEREGASPRQPDPAVAWTRRRLRPRVVEAGGERPEPFPRHRRDRDDLAAREAGSGEHGFDVARHDGEPILTDQIALV